MNDAEAQRSNAMRVSEGRTKKMSVGLRLGAATIDRIECATTKSQSRVQSKDVSEIVMVYHSCLLSPTLSSASHFPSPASQSSSSLRRNFSSSHA